MFRPLSAKVDPRLSYVVGWFEGHSGFDVVEKFVPVPSLRMAHAT